MDRGMKNGHMKFIKKKKKIKRSHSIQLVGINLSGLHAIDWKWLFTHTLKDCLRGEISSRIESETLIIFESFFKLYLILCKHCGIKQICVLFLRSSLFHYFLFLFCLRTSKNLSLGVFDECNLLHNYNP